jgi:hypothetical protein
MREVDRPRVLLQAGSDNLATKVINRNFSEAVTALRTRLEQLCSPVKANVNVHKLREDASPVQQE